MGIKVRDKFKVLDNVRTNINNLSTHISRALNTSLPNRILSRANIFNMSINVARDLTTMVILQLEDSLVEQNILIAQKETSVRGLSTLSGHHATRAISSKGVVKLSFKRGVSNITGSFIVLNGAEFRSIENGLTYVMLEDSKTIHVNDNEGTNLTLIEGSFNTHQHIAEGISLEKVELDDNFAIENGNISVKVDGVPYKQADSLYDMPKGSKFFMVKNGIGSQVDVIFGNDVYGEKLKEGAVVDIRYLTTNGEDGNVSTESTFEIETGVYGSDGTPVSIESFVEITIESGFQLGSNGENIETTRLLAGMTSRSMVFARPENLQSYLSRLTILSHIRVWSEPDELVFKMLLLPNLRNKLNTYSEYFSLGDEDMKLTENQKLSVLDYISSSDSQVTTTEFQFIEPKFERYAMFVYLSGEFTDRKQTRDEIYDVVAEYMLEKTFLSNIVFDNYIIPRSEVINRLVDRVDGIREVNINVISEANESAKINGHYDIVETIVVGSANKKKSVRYNLKEGENPNLGFNELGSIQPMGDISIPILSKNIHIYNNSEIFVSDKPIYIFYKNINGHYEEL